MRKIIDTYQYTSESLELLKEMLNINQLSRFIIIETIEED